MRYQKHILYITLFASCVTPYSMRGSEDAELQRALEASAQEAQAREDKDLKAALQEIKEAQELEAINRQIAEMEKETARREREQEKKRRKSVDVIPSSVSGITHTVSQNALRKNLPIDIVRPEIVQQEGTQCGYFTVIYGAELYDASATNTVKETLAKFKDKARMKQLLQEKQKALGYCKTLETVDIMRLLQGYGFITPLDPEVRKTDSGYSISDYLLPHITQLSLTDPVLAAITKLQLHKNATHLFILRTMPKPAKAGAPEKGLGHWISVVAHNVNGKKIDFYILDSLYPEEETPDAARIREDHDFAWERLRDLFKGITIL